MEPKRSRLHLKAFTDVDWAGSVDDRKSISGATFHLGDCLVSWLRNNPPLQYLQQKMNTLLSYHVALNSFG